jgi:hypothetical protein
VNIIGNSGTRFVPESGNNMNENLSKKFKSRIDALESLGSQLSLALRDMVDRFSPNDEGLSRPEIDCAARARIALKSAHVVLIDYYKDNVL